MLMHATESDLRIPVQVDDFADICDTVENICAKFPAKYWRDLEDRPVRERFPEAFVAALSEAGIFGTLVPEAHGGTDLSVAAVATIIETIHACGCNGSVHSQVARRIVFLGFGDFGDFGDCASLMAPT